MLQTAVGLILFQQVFDAAAEGVRAGFLAAGGFDFLFEALFELKAVPAGAAELHVLFDFFPNMIVDFVIEDLIELVEPLFAIHLSHARSPSL